MEPVHNTCMKFRSLISSVLLTFFAVGLPVTAVFAQQRGFLQGGFLQRVGSRSGVPTGSGDQLIVVIGNLINVVLAMLGLILLGFLLYAGFLWMTAQGEDDQVKKAKSIIKNAIIGLVITTLAFSITNFTLTSLNEAFTRSSTTPPPSGAGSGT